MTQRSLIFDKDCTCGWCLTRTASTMLYGTPTCLECASGKPKDRVTAWLGAVAPKQGR